MIGMYPKVAEADCGVPVSGRNSGQMLVRYLAKDPRQQYFLYVPELVRPGAKVMVVVHGISRNAREQVQHFSCLAKERGVFVVGPSFPRDRFPDYQRLGLHGRGERSDLTVRKILAEVARLTGADVRRIYLFGYSGGGQFVHRYAMAYPQGVAAAAIGAAGWYTFPDFSARYPRGLKLSAEAPVVSFQEKEFLKIPMAVFVGERDFRRGTELKRSRAVDRQQGLTRIERGYRWIKAMEASARNHGLSTRYEFKVLSRTGHSFVDGMRRGGMGEKVFDFLFGTSRQWEIEPRKLGGEVSLRPVALEKLKTGVSLPQAGNRGRRKREA